MKKFFLALLFSIACYAQTPVGGRVYVGTQEGALATAFRPDTGNGAPAAANCNTAVAITSSTNATPIVITKTAHGFSNGDVITVYGHAVNTAANGTWMVANKTANTYELAGYWDGTTNQNPSVGNGVGGATGFASKQVGRIYFRNDATAGQNLYYCTDSTGSPAWTQQLNSGAGGASSALSNLAAVSINTSLLAQTGVDAGSAANAFREIYIWGTGTYGTTSIKFTGAPTSNRVVTFPDVNSNTVVPSSAGANTYATGISAGGVITYSSVAVANLSDGTTLMKNNASNTVSSGTQDFSGAAHTLPALKGTIAAKPATCTQGELYFATDATAGQNIYECGATNTWTQQLLGIREINAGFTGGPSFGQTTICRNVAYSGTIQAVTLASDAAGAGATNNQVDIKTVAYGSYTGPASAASITASATPKLGTGVKYTDATLTGWTTALAANTEVCAVLTLPSTATWITVNLQLVATK